MRKRLYMSLIIGIVLLAAGPAAAHFGMLIPSSDIVTQQNKNLELTLSFSHPFEGHGMKMEKPAAFYVVRDKQKTDLLKTLKKTVIMGHQAWHTTYKVKRPGVYQFAVIPKPYWEPAEDISIIHYTKTIVAAYGADTGWDRPLGLPTEIVPLLRPFGNYAGNSFVGQVLLNGKPVPFAEVEVEFYNRGQKLKAPSDYHVTQLIKADPNGIFTFTCPRPGWWGFAALNEADYKLKNPEGREKGVELGAVLWIYLDKYQER